MIPNVKDYSIELLGSMDFEKNFLCWRKMDDKLYAFKEPNIIITWDVTSGKVINQRVQENIYIKGFQKHSEWNNAFLLKLKSRVH